MARTPATVASFLTGLAKDLRPLADADLASLTARKHVRRMWGGGSVAGYVGCLEGALIRTWSFLLSLLLQAEEGADSGPLLMSDYRCAEASSFFCLPGLVVSG
jgi:hypothetical protein